MKYFHLGNRRNNIKLIVLVYLALFRFAAKAARGSTKYYNVCYNIKVIILLPDAVRVGECSSEVRVEKAVVVGGRVLLVSPGPALTVGLVLIFQLSRRISNVVFVHHHYLAEDLTLLIVRDRGEDIQHGGVGPALVNLENKDRRYRVSVNLLSGTL